MNNLNDIDSKVEPTLIYPSENFVSSNKDVLHPTSFKTIMRFQQKD